MAYQNVGTPRFYIDQIQYLKSINFDFDKYDTLLGVDNDVNDFRISDYLKLFDLDPVFQERYERTDESEGKYMSWNVPFFPLNFSDTSPGNMGLYASFLNFYYTPNWRTLIEFRKYHETNDTIGYGGTNKTEILNFGNDYHDNASKPGSFIVDISDSDISEATHMRIGLGYITLDSYSNHFLNAGAISYGVYYDIPVNPDLDLSMNIEFDGFDNTQTLNGGKLTNTRYMGSPWWFDVDGKKVEPWSVGESTGVSKRNGRRTWNLKFSYMSDKDLFASNYGSSTYLETATDVDPEDIDDLNLGQSILTNGDFSAGTTGWYFADCSGTIGTYFGFNNVCQIEVDSPDTVGMYQVNVTTEDVTYKYSFDYYIPSGNTNLDAVQLRANSSSNNKIIDSQTVTDTWTSVYAYYTPTSSATDDIWIYLNSTSTGGDDLTVGNSIYVKNIKIEPVIGDDFQYTIDDDDSFSAQVLNKISHGQKFIFQPDNTNNNPDQFAICVLDQDSFSMKRTAHNVYDISMKIKEVW